MLRKLVPALLIPASLLALAVPAQAATLYWKYAGCYAAGYSGSLGVGWEKSGGSERPDQVSYTADALIQNLSVDEHKGSTIVAHAYYYEGGNRNQDVHNWASAWETTSGLYVVLRIQATNGQYCQAVVYPA